MQPVYLERNREFLRQKYAGNRVTSFTRAFYIFLHPFCRSGGSKGGARASPLFLDQTEAQRAEKFFFETAAPAPYLKMWIRHCAVLFKVDYKFKLVA